MLTMPHYMLSKGLLQDKRFTSILTMIAIARRAEPLDLMTVLVDSDFAFPDHQFFEGLEDRCI